ncbi:MAG: AAA family ATPase [Patescibacteria group bacterium]|nr:AAA family ATPase [Patescibacteria group bacterium]MDD5534774.1 AAA family ATPase [Patescibacteria group bacterium]
MEIALPNQIYGDKKIIIDDSKSVFVFIGANGSGKSKLMDQIKAHMTQQTKIISDGINSVPPINTIDEESVKQNSWGNKVVDNVTSLINGNDTVRQVIFFWFKKLFGKEISKEGNQYWITEDGNKFQLNADGDGYKTFFNLAYYLTTPDYKYLIFDEPERFLHPNLQISLFNMIKKLSRDYGKQVFITTHSSHFIDFLSDGIEVFLLSKPKKETFNLTEKINSSSDKNFTTWIHYNKHILFSKTIVLLEGYTDQIFLNQLLQKLNHSVFGRNISFISVAVEKENGGKSKIVKFQKIISEFFTCWSLFDLDLLLNSGGELSKYLDATDVTEFGTWRNSKTLDDLSNLLAEQEMTKVFKTLKAKKVLILEKGAIEKYCKKIGVADKLKDKLYEEVDYLNSLTLDLVESEYGDLINIISSLDGFNFDENDDLSNLVFRLIMDFEKEAKTLNPYQYLKIPKSIQDHLFSDPDKGASYEFRFRFLSDKLFSIKKTFSTDEKKDYIDSVFSSSSISQRYLQR